MSRITATIALAACLALLGCGGDSGKRLVRKSSPSARAATVSTIERPEPIRTEQVESGEIRLEEADAMRLEAMLQDLNRRLDYDRSQHDGRPGPDAAYLQTWSDRVVRELLRRGYYTDADGRLRRPGLVVPLR